MMTFLDYFSRQAADYAAFRPTYPAELFSWAAALAPARTAALDCGTGNGQAAVGLADHFERVIAIDASDTQLQHAVAHPRVEYRRSTAEAAGLPDNSVDLVTVAQAFHWFQPESFFAEARRVLVTGGAVVLWAYGLPEINRDVDSLVRDHYGGTLRSHWAPERRIVDEKYRTLQLPLDEIEAPQFAMITTMTPAGLAGYVRSWSATRNYIRDLGEDPFDRRLQELAACWGDEERLEAHWPIYIRAGYFRV